MARPAHPGQPPHPPGLGRPLPPAHAPNPNDVRRVNLSALHRRLVIGTKVRALADRGAVRDLIDVHAASRLRTTPELEHLGRRHGRDEFRLEELHDRLAGADWYDDEEFEAYGLGAPAIVGLRAWSRSWATELGQRLASGDAGEQVC
ncbi:nucleotidyl transferase AbiEii/AbiGii toxin family protein [Streptomyces vinaceus]|uniref:nucleotidyl transferase AbiEii/AbiGii toxin family protein n=1 Tax=Streptomyces vinaceus TaxID=1960 RepID=UPI003815537F